MLPKLFSIGDFTLHSYGLLVATGFLLGLWLTARLARRSGLDAELVLNLGVYSALAGLGGAKLLMILFDLDYYARNPSALFSLSTLQFGGIFYGGLLVALAFAFVYMRRKALPPGRTLDAFAPGIALGHSIGRLGCFDAGCCWGDFCPRPWAVTFRDPDAEQIVGVPLNVPLHPTQLYEAGAYGLIASFLYRRYRPEQPAGSLIGLFLLLTAAARFLVEFFRFHSSPNPFFGPLTLAQYIAVALAAAGAALLARPNSRRPVR